MREREHYAAPYEFRSAFCFPASVVAGAIAGGVVPQFEFGKSGGAIVAGALLGAFVGAICGFTGKSVPRSMLAGVLGGVVASWIMCSLVSFGPRPPVPDKRFYPKEEKKSEPYPKEEKKSRPELGKPRFQRPEDARRK